LRDNQFAHDRQADPETRLIESYRMGIVDKSFKDAG